MSCAAFRLIRMTVHSTAWSVAKLKTKAEAPVRFWADASTQAESRRRLSRRVLRRRGKLADDGIVGGMRCGTFLLLVDRVWVARFRLPWNQVDGKNSP